MVSPDGMALSRIVCVSQCLPLLIFPCTIKSRSSLLAPAHPGGPGKRAVKRLCGMCHYRQHRSLGSNLSSLVI